MADLFVVARISIVAEIKPGSIINGLNCKFR